MSDSKTDAPERAVKHELQLRFIPIADAAARLGQTVGDLLQSGYLGLISLCVDLYGHATDLKARVIDDEHRGGAFPRTWPAGILEVTPDDLRWILRANNVTTSEFSRCNGAVSVEISPEATFGSNDLVVLEEELTRFADWFAAQPKVGKPTVDRDRELQEAANQLANEWKKSGRKVLSKHDVAVALAKSDAWQDMTAPRIKRVIRVRW